MKVTLWQQFSSNHSGTFWIVGVFGSPETMRDAREKIRQVFLDIAAWHDKHPEAVNKAWTTGGNPLEPEKDASEKYNVEWPRTIDWYGWSKPTDRPRCIDHLFSNTHNVLFLTPPDDTWMPMQPFKGLVEYFGGKTIGFDIDHQEGWEKWFFRLTCIAPDEDTAKRLQTLPKSLDLQKLTIKQDNALLEYVFQITTYPELGGLGAVLKSNGCKDIHVDLLEMNGS